MEPVGDGPAAGELGLFVQRAVEPGEASRSEAVESFRRRLVYFVWETTNEKY